ncbi:hypothetical protein [Arenibaculum pallidiluteum]|uniref:hypothetical protein n=1 Tax=Arenibaculum pallidiluteum TaxID=2812559 RepID=UPI001A97294F|nr:hypothetical protein [Arenibaculum pallidiluteum]
MMATARRLGPAAAAALALLLVLALPFSGLPGPAAGDGLLGRAVAANREVLARAAAAFAATKAIDATLAVVASAEVSGTVPLVGGVGASVAPGSALRPVADLVRSFGSVMLAVASAAAAIEILLRIGAALGTPVLLPVGLALLVAAALLGLVPGGGAPRIGAAARRLGRALAVGGLALGFFMPAAVLGASEISRSLIEPDWRLAAQGLSAWEARTGQAPAEAPARGTSLLDRLAEMRDIVSRNLERVDVAGLLSGLQDLFHDLVLLIAAFALRAMILPSLLLWAMLRALRLLIGPPAPAGAVAVATTVAEPASATGAGHSPPQEP